jgi:hypothetical protein
MCQSLLAIELMHSDSSYVRIFPKPLRGYILSVTTILFATLNQVRRL